MNLYDYVPGFVFALAVPVLLVGYTIGMGWAYRVIHESDDYAVRDFAAPVCVFWPLLMFARPFMWAFRFGSKPKIPKATAQERWR